MLLALSLRKLITTGDGGMLTTSNPELGPKISAIQTSLNELCELLLRLTGFRYNPSIETRERSRMSSRDGPQ